MAEGKYFLKNHETEEQLFVRLDTKDPLHASHTHRLMLFDSKLWAQATANAMNSDSESPYRPWKVELF